MQIFNYVEATDFYEWVSKEFNLNLDYVQDTILDYDHI